MSKKTLRGRRGSLENMERLNKVFNRVGIQRGDLNEGVVKELLVELKKEKKISRFEQNRELDRSGIDKLVYLFDSRKFAIQVKSSLKGAEKHYKKYGTSIRFRNKDIRCLVLIVNPKHLVDRNDLKSDIEKFINDY